MPAVWVAAWGEVWPMSDLNERVAMALARAVLDGKTTLVELADAVIADLQLEPEYGCATASHHGCRCSHRFSTEWRVNE